MPHFNPTRASPPAKSLASSTATLSGNNNVLAPELLHLSSEDVNILDAIIERAGHSATTFFTVFKAYSDVLRERGLHPQEVVYYGKLLKLGTLKGRNWGEKWNAVKAQLDSVSQTWSYIYIIYILTSMLAIFCCTYMPNFQVWNWRVWIPTIWYPSCTWTCWSHLWRRQFSIIASIVSPGYEATFGTRPCGEPQPIGKATRNTSQNFKRLWFLDSFSNTNG